MIKAVINGDRIECGKCGALLAKLQPIAIVGHQAELVDKGETKVTSKFEIKCKHKERGVTCNEVNEILL